MPVSAPLAVIRHAHIFSQLDGFVVSGNSNVFCRCFAIFVFVRSERSIPHATRIEAFPFFSGSKATGYTGAS